MKRTIFLALATWALATSSIRAQPAKSDLAQEWRDWHQQRTQSLAAENGWLNLAGRFALAAGRSSFGAAKNNHIVFPAGKCPDLLGHFLLKNDTIWLETAPNAPILANGKPIAALLRLYPSDSSITLQSGSLRWFVIRRGAQFIVRLRDLEHPALRQFGGVPTYPFDAVWRVKARLEPTQGRQIAITNILGQTSMQDSPGTLVFEWQGKTQRLDAVLEGEQLFILFSDETTGATTYGSGRFLYADQPDASGHTLLDFNRAINPPCAFTDFATCPLPPPQNALPFAVTAGEKNYGGH
jgi:uncharacterized protein (DUF1684 family)